MYWEIIDKYPKYSNNRDIYLKLHISNDDMYLLDFECGYFNCYHRYTYVYTEHVEYGKPRRFVSENVITVNVFKRETVEDFLKELNKHVGHGKDLTLNFYSLWDIFKERVGI